jgi:ubiquinone/menaquinone biosynthesis C-methylase UbiE
MKNTLDEPMGEKLELEKLARKIELGYNSELKNIIQRFKGHKTRISISTGSSQIIDEYIDRRQKEVISKILATNEKIGTCLDVGCGAGRWTDFFCERAKKLVGIDKSIDILRIAEIGKPKNAHFLCCLMTSLPFRDNSFDLSFCCFSLLFLIRESDFNKAVSELIRVTKHGRKIIIIDITAKKQSITAWTLRRTSNQYIKAFLLHGAVLREVFSYRIDLPLRGYQFMCKKLLKPFCKRESQDFNNDFWRWIEEKGHMLRHIVEFGLRLIILFMYPLDKMLSERLFQPICPEKVFVFEKLEDSKWK